MAQWYWSDSTTVTFQQVDIWLWRGCLAGWLTYWLGRSASQERFYDTDYRSKSTYGPQTTISPPGLLSLPNGLSVALLRCRSGLLISATMKIELDWLWSSYPISQNGPNWLSPTAATATCPSPWQLPRGSVNFGRIINMWVIVIVEVEIDSALLGRSQKNVNMFKCLVLKLVYNCVWKCISWSGPEIILITSMWKSTFTVVKA